MILSMSHAATPQVDEGFAALLVKDVVRETADAVSLVLDVPTAHADRFRYSAGQFLTLQVVVNGEAHRRCYSMSSSPAAEADLRITVKRDRDGLVSNWLNDTVEPGQHLHAAPPDGRFVLTDTDRELVTFAGGSGITPVYSLIRHALAATDRRARLFYANRTADSVIFAAALAEVLGAHHDRLSVHHHLDESHGTVSADHIDAFLDGCDDAEYYICGPAPFMDAVESTLLGRGVPADRIHLERFSVATVEVDGSTPMVTEDVTIVLGRNTVTVPYRAGNTLLQTARLAGLNAPSSCETGSCGTCIAAITEGGARMLNNDALDEDEVAEGLVVTCQAIPTSRTVRVVYE